MADVGSWSWESGNCRAGTSTRWRERRHDGSLETERRSLGCSPNLDGEIPALTNPNPDMERPLGVVSIRFYYLSFFGDKSMNKSRGSHMLRGYDAVVGDAEKRWSLHPHEPSWSRDKRP